MKIGIAAAVVIDTQSIFSLNEFVFLAYFFTTVILFVICLDSYLRWRRVRSDYQRLFARKDKESADA